MKKNIYLFIDYILNIFSKIYRIIWKLFLSFTLLIFLIILFANLIVIFSSQGKIYYNVENVPDKKVALVLGTSKYVAGNIGLVNLFYKKRLDAANELFDSGNIEYLILSGTRDGIYYNEPETMKADLMKMGIPEDKIYLDYSGFRTFDSLMRARDVFLQKDIVIVSQKFHLQRALLIAKNFDMTAVGYVAKNPPFWLALPVYVRESLSRVKLFFDIFIRNESKIYEERIIIGAPSFDD